MPYLLVLSTAPSKKEALKLADLLLRQRLAACINISTSIDSLYWWKGKREKAKEVLLFIKTTTRGYGKLEKALRKHHPYSVPEIIAIPIAKGNPAYLKWLSGEVR